MFFLHFLFMRNTRAWLVDPWAGYTAADDARDRAVGGLQPNEAWPESARIQRADAHRPA